MDGFFQGILNLLGAISIPDVLGLGTGDIKPIGSNTGSALAGLFGVIANALQPLLDNFFAGIVSAFTGLFSK
jgi:hypothetical protein